MRESWKYGTSCNHSDLVFILEEVENSIKTECAYGNAADTHRMACDRAQQVLLPQSSHQQAPGVSGRCNKVALWTTAPLNLQDLVVHLDLPVATPLTPRAWRVTTRSRCCSCMARLSRLRGPSGTAAPMRCSAVPFCRRCSSLDLRASTRDCVSSNFLCAICTVHAPFTTKLHAEQGLALFCSSISVLLQGWLLIRDFSVWRHFYSLAKAAGS